MSLAALDWWSTEGREEVPPGSRGEGTFWGDDDDDDDVYHTTQLSH